MAEPGIILTQQAAQQVIKAAKIVLQGGNYGSIDNSVSASGVQCITALLQTKGDGAFYSAWQQERRTSTAWETVVNGLTDTGGKYPAYCLDENDDSDLTDTHVVLARVAVRNADETTGQAWVIVGTAGGASIDDPTLQGQVLQATSQNQYGWQFPVLHAAT